jgi:hypothetical protein
LSTSIFRNHQTDIFLPSHSGEEMVQEKEAQTRASSPQSVTRVAFLASASPLENERRVAQFL